MVRVRFRVRFRVRVTVRDAFCHVLRPPPPARAQRAIAYGDLVRVRVRVLEKLLYYNSVLNRY